MFEPQLLIFYLLSFDFHYLVYDVQPASDFFAFSVSDFLVNVWENREDSRVHDTKHAISWSVLQGEPKRNFSSDICCCQFLAITEGIRLCWRNFLLTNITWHCGCCCCSPIKSTPHKQWKKNPSVGSTAVAVCSAASCSCLCPWIIIKNKVDVEILNFALRVHALTCTCSLCSSFIYSWAGAKSSLIYYILIVLMTLAAT